MNIGIAGVGKMGAAIAARLMETGNQATVWNRSPEKTKPLADAGAKIAATPAELANAVEVVITILTDAAAINAAAALMPDATKEQADTFNELQRRTTSVECAARYLETTAEFDVTGLLPQGSPTLAMQRAAMLRFRWAVAELSGSG